MKKKLIAAALMLSMVLGMVSSVAADTEKEVPETSTVRWNYGTSGNVLALCLSC